MDDLDQHHCRRVRFDDYSKSDLSPKNEGRREINPNIQPIGRPSMSSKGGFESEKTDCDSFVRCEHP